MKRYAYCMDGYKVSEGIDALNIIGSYMRT